MQLGTLTARTAVVLRALPFAFLHYSTTTLLECCLARIASVRASRRGRLPVSRLADASRSAGSLWTRGPCAGPVPGWASFCAEGGWLGLSAGARDGGGGGWYEPGSSLTDVIDQFIDEAYALGNYACSVSGNDCIYYAT